MGEAYNHSMKYDVIVLGVGAMGSATCLALAKRGQRVLGIERFQPGHDRGSSHGDSRLIRKAYFEHPDYVPLCERAYRLWSEISHESGRALLHLNGLVIFGREGDSPVLEGVRKSAALHKLDVEFLPPADIARRFLAFRPPSGFGAAFEPGAGFLDVEDGVRAMASLAQQHGAEIRSGEEVFSWTCKNADVEVSTDHGVYQAKKLVITAGPWSGQSLADLGLPMVVRRVMQFWFSAPPALSVERSAPCFAFDLKDGFVYGVPAKGGMGIKIASHKPGEIVEDPLRVDRDCHSRDLKGIENVRGQYLVGVGEKPQRHAVCLYTLTPDEHFILDLHPRHSNVAFAAGFSGHGFKFAPVVGEAMADLALEGKSSLPISFLSLKRNVLMGGDSA